MKFTSKLWCTRKSTHPLDYLATIQW